MLSLGSFSPKIPASNDDEVISLLIACLALRSPVKASSYYEIGKKRGQCPKTRAHLIRGLTKELNRFAPPFCYVGHALNDESNWGVWIDLGKLHEAEEKGQLVQDTKRPLKGRSRYVLVHDEGGLRLFRRKGWVEVWRV